MEPITIVAAVAAGIKAIIDLAPGVISTIDDAKPYAEKLIALIKGENITQDELDAFLVDLTAKHVKFQEPLPPEDSAA